MTEGSGHLGQGRQPEGVCLITDLDPTELNALDRLNLNRQAWAIEAGLHQRLDLSHNDDRRRRGIRFLLARRPHLKSFS